MKGAIGIYCNPSAGRGTKTKQTLEDLTAKLKADGHAFSIIPNESPKSTSAWLEQNSDANTFIILGGDGTINFMARCLPSLKDITILPIPLGTANIIAHNGAKSLAIALATNSHQTAPCLFGASFGFDAAVVASLGAKRTGNISIFSYAAPIIKMLFSFKSHKQIVSIDNKTVGAFDFGIIAQTAIYGSRCFKLTNTKEKSCWRVFLIKNLTLYNMLQALCYGLFWNLKNAPCVSCYKLQAVTVKPSTTSTKAQIDGEDYDSSPLTITVTNNALTILKNISKS